MFSSPCSSFVVSVTTAESVSHQNSSVGTKAGFAASSATGLRHFRINAPSAAAALLPAPTPARRQLAAGNHDQHKRIPIAARCPQQKVSNNQYEMYYQKFSSAAALAGLRPPAQQTQKTANVGKTVSKQHGAQLATTFSPSKFFVPGGLDFDDYIGKLVPAVAQSQGRMSQNQPMTKSVSFKASSADVAEPKMKQCSLECAGVKKKQDTVSPSKFFVPGGLDFDDYIGKPVPAFAQSQGRMSQNRPMAKSVSLKASSADVAEPIKKPCSLEYAGVKRKQDRIEPPRDAHSTWKTDADVEKPKRKRQSPVCASTKRKLHLTELPVESEPNSTQKKECRFADKYLESLSFQDLLDNTEVDGTGNKYSADTCALRKESGVCMLLYSLLTYLDSYGVDIYVIYR